MLRNLAYAVANILHIIPYLGTFLFFLVFIHYFIIEDLMVLFTDRRIGDRMAGIIVVKDKIEVS